MKEQVLSIEQMQELIDMGVDVSKASIYWSVNKVNARGSKSDLMPPFLTFSKTNLTVGWASFEYIPTFTLQDILEMLIKYINVNDKVYFLTLMYDVSEGVVISYCSEHIMDILHSEGSSKQINAAFNMLKWCKQNNYI